MKFKEYELEETKVKLHPHASHISGCNTCVSHIYTYLCPFYQLYLLTESDIS